MDHVPTFIGAAQLTRVAATRGSAADKDKKDDDKHRPEVVPSDDEEDRLFVRMAALVDKKLAEQRKEFSKELAVALQAKTVENAAQGASKRNLLDAIDTAVSGSSSTSSSTAMTAASSTSTSSASLGATTGGSVGLGAAQRAARPLPVGLRADEEDDDSGAADAAAASDVNLVEHVLQSVRGVATGRYFEDVRRFAWSNERNRHEAEVLADIIDAADAKNTDLVLQIAVRRAEALKIFDQTGNAAVLDVLALRSSLGSNLDPKLLGAALSLANKWQRAQVHGRGGGSQRRGRGRGHGRGGFNNVGSKPVPAKQGAGSGK